RIKPNHQEGWSGLLRCKESSDFGPSIPDVPSFARRPRSAVFGRLVDSSGTGDPAPSSNVLKEVAAEEPYLEEVRSHPLERSHREHDAAGPGRRSGRHVLPQDGAGSPPHA